MAHLIMHGEAPLASGDELTPSSEYTLDEPNPLHADDLAERDQPTPSSDEKPETPPESPTPEGDNTVTLERQPIHAQVTKKADREPKEPEDKDKERDSSSDKDKKDSSGDEGKEDSKKKKKDKKKKKKDKDKDEPSEKEKKPKEKTIKIRYRVDKGMPKHRSRCVACGCARLCCVENFVFLWVVLFILIQAGPLAVLVWDFLNVNSYGIAISRYVAEWNMQPAVCRVESMEFTDLSTCDCLLSNTRCKEPIAEYGCMQVKAYIFTYNHTGPISNGSNLWKSEREYVLDKTSPKCFNLDICKIDKTNPWHAYRNQTIRDERLLRDKWKEEEGFVCYYKEVEDDSYVAVMEMNTSIWQVLLWFFLPLLGILLCWVIICTCLCWYCCPPARYVTRIKKKNGGGNYHEVVSAEQDDAGGPEYDPNAIKEPLCYDDRGEHAQEGTWHPSGPGAASDAAAF